METEAIDTDLDELSGAIYAAVAYRDVFDFPLTVDEIHRSLPLVECSIDDVKSTLANGDLVPDSIVTDGEFYALRGRESCFATRRQRKTKTLRLWPRAVKFGRLLATLPFVEMVAVSGSLAAENPGDNADIDFFVLVRAGHLWRTRVLMRVLRRLDFSIGTRTFCPNSTRTTAALEIELQSLYTAQELVQLQPVYGYHVYQRMMLANGWAAGFLPNTRAAEGLAVECHPYSPYLRSLLELLLDTAPGNAFERWFCKRKVAQFSAPGHVFSSYSAFGREQEGLNVAFANKVERLYRQRLTDRQ